MIQWEGEGRRVLRCQAGSGDDSRWRLAFGRLQDGRAVAGDEMRCWQNTAGTVEGSNAGVRWSLFQHVVLFSHKT